MDICIVGAARTPIGGLLGELAPLTAPRLGAAAIAAALDRAGLAPDGVAGVVMGNVLPAGLGQAPARQAAIGAGIPVAAPAVTINKMCGSGMQALIQCHDQLAAGGTGILVAGGMESMSNAPFLLPRLRGGVKYGHSQVIDSMALDGLEDAFEPGRAMGTYADVTARELGFSRADQDAFAERSLRLAQVAGSNARRVPAAGAAEVKQQVSFAERGGLGVGGGIGNITSVTVCIPRITCTRRWHGLARRAASLVGCCAHAIRQ